MALVVKNPPANAGDRRCRFNPWDGKIPWRRAWQPTPVFLTGEFHGQRSLVGYSSWVAKSQTWLKWLSTQHTPSFRTLFPTLYYLIDFIGPLNTEYKSLATEKLIPLPKASLEGKYLHSIFSKQPRKRKIKHNNNNKQSLWLCSTLKNLKENGRCDFWDFIIWWEGEVGWENEKRKFTMKLYHKPINVYNPPEEKSNNQILA